MALLEIFGSIVAEPLIPYSAEAAASFPRLTAVSTKCIAEDINFLQPIDELLVSSFGRNLDVELIFLKLECHVFRIMGSSSGGSRSLAVIAKRISNPNLANNPKHWKSCNKVAACGVVDTTSVRACLELSDSIWTTRSLRESLYKSRPSMETRWNERSTILLPKLVHMKQCLHRLANWNAVCKHCCPCILQSSSYSLKPSSASFPEFDLMKLLWRMAQCMPICMTQVNVGILINANNIGWR